MRKGTLALAGLFAAFAVLLSGCEGEQASPRASGDPASNPAPNQTNTTDQTNQASRTEGAIEPVDVNVGLIMGPPSMGLGYFMNEAEEGRTFNRYRFEVAGVDYSAVAASLNQGDYDIATLPSNVAAILYNNEDMNEDVEVISIGNLGLLYLLTTDPNLASLNDLQGRTVYSIGEGGPPEYTFDYVLEQAGLTNDVNFSFRPTPFEVLNLLQEQENAIALLPQPFVEVAKLLVPGLRVAIDLTETWDELNKGSDAQSVTTVTVVRKSFLEEHEQAVAEYLEMAKRSTDYTLVHLDEAAAWTEKYETFLNPEIAKEAIPQSSIHTITGREMKDTLSGFLQIMYDFNPEAIGGKMPGDDFYYLPPEE
ncbi:ABC transporter substrate-binding protein [Cohnella fermenti]|uniref:ABC transporter substrate-binding protein n=1 Tax=Cohnella fermenti TaxID=2565925 RepID=A0A4S4C6S3_9BACL|nr:ABC transporter substrate-binding protein [Cohnella fermenti]THF83308.1 ABC transporter substrate-binding protein [Cohnella fermenti]